MTSNDWKLRPVLCVLLLIFALQGALLYAVVAPNWQEILDYFHGIRHAVFPQEVQC